MKLSFSRIENSPSAGHCLKSIASTPGGQWTPIENVALNEPRLDAKLAGHLEQQFRWSSDGRLARKGGGVMYARTYPHTYEVLRWIVVAALACALALTWVGNAAGQTTAIPPQPLGESVAAEALSMPPSVAMDDYEQTLHLYRIMDWYEQGNLVASMDRCGDLQLPEEHGAWKHLIRAIVLRDMKRLDEAVEELWAAREYRPNSPLVHFVLGQIYLEQAVTAEDWSELPSIWTCVISPPRVVVPNNSATYRLAAAEAYSDAIKYAGLVNPDVHVLRSDWVMPPAGSGDMPLQTPTVNDLMSAFRLDRFQAESHLALGHLMLDRGMLSSSAEHLAAAAEWKEPTAELYAELGDRYKARGEYREATRAYLRSMQHGGSIVRPLQNVLDNFSRGLGR